MSEIRKNLIFFLTLSISVAIIYAFNAMGEQATFLEAQENLMMGKKVVEMGVTYISFFVAFIFAFLLVYSNDLRLKQKKNEIGIYLLLGMSRKRVARIFISQTIFMSIVALFFGIFLGFGLSQLLLNFALWIFDQPLHIAFSFAMKSLIKAIVYYAIIFSLIMILTVRRLSKMKLIDLFQASKKRERLKMPGASASSVLLLLSIAILGSAYCLITENGFQKPDLLFLLSIVLGIIGNFLFFYSVGGLLIALISSGSSLMYRKLNIFSYKEITHSVRSHFIMMGIVCIVLLLSIGIFATAKSVEKSFSLGVEYLDYDVSYYADTEDVFDAYEKELQDIKHVMIHWSFDPTSNDEIISLSDLNKLLEFKGLKPVELVENKKLLVTNDPNRESSDTEEVVHITVSNMHSFMDTLVVSDEDFEKVPQDYDEVVLNIADQSEKAKRVIDTITKQEKYSYYQSKDEMKNDTLLASLSMSIFGFYLALVFIICAGAVQAISGINDLTDARHRYRVLRELGADKKMILASVTKQMRIYFFLPLALAAVHSFFGIRAFILSLKQMIDAPIEITALLASIVVLVIYGLYYLIGVMIARREIKKVIA